MPKHYLKIDFFKVIFMDKSRLIFDGLDGSAKGWILSNSNMPVSKRSVIWLLSVRIFLYLEEEQYFSRCWERELYKYIYTWAFTDLMTIINSVKTWQRNYIGDLFIVVKTRVEPVVVLYALNILRKTFNVF